MPFSTGVFKTLAYRVESAWATAPGTGSASLLRRVRSGLDLSKNSYSSNEIRADQQIADMRHGTRRVEGPIDGELSPGTYADFMAGILRKNWVAGVTTGAQTDVTAAAGPPGTFTTAGAFNWLTLGFKIGDIVRWTGWATTGTGNNTRNYRITALTATVMTVGTAATGAAAQPEVVGAKAAGDSVTCTVVGKKTMVPSTGHIEKSFWIEHWFSDISQSEQFSGCEVATMALNLPPTGMSTISMSFMGKDRVTDTAQYFVSPAAVTTSGVLAAVNGIIRVNGADLAYLTGLSMNINGNLGGAEVVGSNVTPALFPGRVLVSGQFTALFTDATMRDYFTNETEISLIAQMTTSSAINADFINIILPRIKVGSATKDDQERQISQSFSFQALLNTSGGTGTTGDASTIIIQDSLAP